jgi:hypothetical protein
VNSVVKNQDDNATASRDIEGSTKVTLTPLFTLNVRDFEGLNEGDIDIDPNPQCQRP